MNIIQDKIQGVIKLINYLALLSLACMMGLTFIDVILRYFGYPIKGANDIVSLLGAAVFALPIAYTQMYRGHISIEFISYKYPGWLKKVVDFINYLLNLCLYSILAWQLTLYGFKMQQVGRVSETLQVPIYPFPFVISFGCILMCLMLIIELFNVFKQE